MIELPSMTAVVAVVIVAVMSFVTVVGAPEMVETMTLLVIIEV